MSFKENAYQQMSFTDSFSGLTAREQKALEKSWAKVFADEIFPAIDEKRFSVLYSDKASRPNTPVNVIVGALIIKELFDYSDDEMVENLMLDFRIQYALHTTSFEEQLLSDKTLSRFRKRCYDYETLHNKDLYHDCVKELSTSIAKLMGISGKVRRMDSMMIESKKFLHYLLVYSIFITPCSVCLSQSVTGKQFKYLRLSLFFLCQFNLYHIDFRYIVFDCTIDIVIINWRTVRTGKYQVLKFFMLFPYRAFPHLLFCLLYLLILQNLIYFICHRNNTIA